MRRRFSSVHWTAIVVTQMENFEAKDVSFYEGQGRDDESSQGGKGYDFPKDTTKRKLFTQSDTDDAASLAGFTPKVSKFTAGNDELFDARGSQSQSPHWHSHLRKRHQVCVCVCVRSSWTPQPL